MSRENHSKCQSPLTGHAQVLLQRKPRQPAGLRERRCQSDRSAPVMSDKSGILDAELGEERRHHRGVVLGPEAEAGGRPRKAEAGQVDGDAAVVRTKGADHMPIEKRPGRISMDHEQRGALPLVHVMNVCSVYSAKVAVEREGARHEIECLFCVRHGSRPDPARPVQSLAGVIQPMGAPPGSVRMTMRPTPGISKAGCTTLAPACVAFFTRASTSSTAM